MSLRTTGGYLASLHYTQILAYRFGLQMPANR